MVKMIHSICIWVLMIIGVIHLVFGAFSFDSFSARFLWFEGTGLAMIFCSAIHFVFRRYRSDVFVYRLAQLVAGLFLVFVSSMNYVALMLPGIVGWLALAGMIGTNRLLHKTAPVR